MTAYHTRFLLLNAIGTAGLVAVWIPGWIAQIVAADSTYIVELLSVLLGVALWQAWRDRWAQVNEIADALVFLGLIGTVIGMILAVAQIDPNMAGDASAAGEMAGHLLHGIGIALYTTLVGSVYAIWLWLLKQVLANGGRE